MIFLTPTPVAAQVKEMFVSHYIEHGYKNVTTHIDDSILTITLELPL